MKKKEPRKKRRNRESLAKGKLAAPEMQETHTASQRGKDSSDQDRGKAADSNGEGSCSGVPAAEATKRRKLTPVKAIRKTYLGFYGGCPKAVRDCDDTENPLWEYRMGKKPPKGTAKRTPLQAIRDFYLWVQCGSRALVREQPLGLPIDPWRFGRRPPVEETYYTEEDEYRWYPWKAEEEQRKRRAKSGRKATRPKAHASTRNPRASRKAERARRRGAKTPETAKRASSRPEKQGKKEESDGSDS